MSTMFCLHTNNLRNFRESIHTSCEVEIDHDQYHSHLCRWQAKPRALDMGEGHTDDELQIPQAFCFRKKKKKTYFLLTKPAT